jgi:hypothetical protein
MSSVKFGYSDNNPLYFTHFSHMTSSLSTNNTERLDVIGGRYWIDYVELTFRTSDPPDSYRNS